MTLKQMRKAKEIRQEDMAKALGVCRKTYFMLENDPKSATIRQAEIISEKLGASVAEIFLARHNTESVVDCYE